MPLVLFLSNGSPAMLLSLNPTRNGCVLIAGGKGDSLVQGPDNIPQYMLYNIHVFLPRLLHESTCLTHIVS
jgi:hypothetical protein